MFFSKKAKHKIDSTKIGRSVTEQAGCWLSIALTAALQYRNDLDAAYAELKTQI